MMEGTGKYFFMLFLVFLIVYVTVKVSLGFLFKRMKELSWKAYVPFYSTLVLVETLELKKKVFWFTLIPFVNLYYYYIIIGKLLEGFKQNPKEAIWFIIIPMYKFPELVFKRPKFALNEYELTEGFLEAQKILFDKPASELPDQINLVDLQKVQEQAEQGVVIEPSSYEQMPNVQEVTASKPPESLNMADSVFTNENLEPDQKHVTYVEVPDETEAKKMSEQVSVTPASDGRPKICPHCGARLAPGATTCFLCGTKLN